MSPRAWIGEMQNGALSFSTGKMHTAAKKQKEKMVQVFRTDFDINIAPFSFLRNGQH